MWCAKKISKQYFNVPYSQVDPNHIRSYIGTLPKAPEPLNSNKEDIPVLSTILSNLVNVYKASFFISFILAKVGKR